MKKSLAALAVMSVLLSACGSKNTGGATSAPSVSPVSTGNAAASSASPTPAATPAPSPSAAPSAKPDAGPVAKTYKMNKNYDMVPIDPNGNKKVVLLTFDDGPKENPMINGLIDILDKHKAKAIFFNNGYRIKAHPELLKLEYDRGQIIGNHSWDHIDLKKEGNAKIDQQVDDVQKIIKDTIGIEPQFFRPPFGSGNDYLRQKVKNDKMLYMTWSNGSLDWDMKNKDKPEEVIKNVMEQLHQGSNILMHELPWTVNALDKMLTQLEEKGYSFLDPRAIDLGLE